MIFTKDQSKEYLSEKERYFGAGITTAYGSEADKNRWIYSMNSSGLYVSEADIDLGTGDNVYEFVHMSDLHIVAMNDEDFKDEQLATSYEHRKFSFPDAVVNGKKAMEYAQYFDKIFVTGDAVDYLSSESLKIMHQLFDGHNVTVTLGNHEFRKVWYGDYTDTEPLEDRLAVIEKNWCNNIYYCAEVLKNRILAISMFTGGGATYEQYYDKPFTAKNAKGEEMTATMDVFFENDIEYAKKMGYAVLIFQHVPVATGKPEETAVPALFGAAKLNFTDRVGNRDADSPTDKKIYKIITENADTVKAIFCGHHHDHYYSEVKAKRTPQSDGYDAVIPQYLAGFTPWLNGSVIKVRVKY